MLSALPLGFNNLMHGYFRTLCVAMARMPGQHDPAYLAVLYRLQREPFWPRACLPVWPGWRLPFRCFAAAVLRFWLFVGAAVFFIGRALLRLDTYTANLPYRILSQQPIVAADKTGRFYRTGRVLDRAEQRYEECQAAGGAARRVSARSSSRVSQTIGEVLMIDKLMSRRCLILEAAARSAVVFRLLISGRILDKKVKKSRTRLKRPRPRAETKHLRDTSCMPEVYDDSAL